VLNYIAREAAGAMGTRLSLRPPFEGRTAPSFWANDFHITRALSALREGGPVRNHLGTATAETRNVANPPFIDARVAARMGGAGFVDAEKLE
jgi:hypothetical protein